MTYVPTGTVLLLLCISLCSPAKFFQASLRPLAGTVPPVAYGFVRYRNCRDLVALCYGMLQSTYPRLFVPVFFSIHWAQL
jgi:hypothetical protein